MQGGSWGGNNGFRYRSPSPQPAFTRHQLVGCLRDRPCGTILVTGIVPVVVNCVGPAGILLMGGMTILGCSLCFCLAEFATIWRERTGGFPLVLNRVVPPAHRRPVGAPHRWHLGLDVLARLVPRRPDQRDLDLAEAPGSCDGRHRHEGSPPVRRGRHPQCRTPTARPVGIARVGQHRLVRPHRAPPSPPKVVHQQWTEFPCRVNLTAASVDREEGTKWFEHRADNQAASQRPPASVPAGRP
jgi:hypothetical protein